MLFFIYDILLHVFALFYFPYMAVRLALKGRKRAGVRQRLGFIDKELSHLRKGKTVWVHAVSVGETIAAVPLVKALMERRPELTVFFSTVTETGQAVAKKELPDATVFYFPFDFSYIVSRVVDRIRPDIFVVVETEIWPNLLRALNRRGVAAVMVNGRISVRSFDRYMMGRFFIRGVLELMTHFHMQSQADADRIKDMGAPPERVSVVGNIKFDQACKALKEGGREVFTRARLGIPEAALVFIAGSTHKGEEEEALAAYREMLASRPDALMVVAPRHPERLQEVAGLLEREGFGYVMKSKLTGEPLTAPKVIILDTMGELAMLYRVGDVNFVGGSWANVGGHNVLEPVAFGKPVFFGPHMSNFAEIGAILKDCGVGIKVKDGKDLASEALRLIAEPERREMLGRLAKETLLRNKGALDRNLELIERYLA